ncbi:MAG TPA: hypothetical protein VMI06_18295 [Terriglobia bacterium]|nr:hypothetical protein [Terriglobia bacterium]
MAHSDGSAFHAAIFAYATLSPKVTSSLQSDASVGPGLGGLAGVKDRDRPERFQGGRSFQPTRQIWRRSVRSAIYGKGLAADPQRTDAGAAIALLALSAFRSAPSKYPDVI